MAIEDKTARLAPIVVPTPEQAAILEKSTLKSGAVPDALRTMAHSPELLRRFNALGGYFMRFSDLPERLIKIAILRVAHRTGSLYEFAQHRQMALEDALLSPKEVEGLVRDDFMWPNHESTCILAVDELVKTFTVSDVTWDKLGGMLPPKAVVDFLMLVGTYMSLAGFLNAVRVELDVTVADRAWPADRSSPTP